MGTGEHYYKNKDENANRFSLSWQLFREREKEWKKEKEREKKERKREREQQIITKIEINTYLFVKCNE